jgi:hypothetical protein
VRPSAGFLLRFFALAGVLFALWSFAGVGDLYARTVIAVANPIVRLMSGFWVSKVTPREEGGGLNVYVRRASGETSLPSGDEDVLVPFQPREQFSGLIPFLALLGATTTLSRRRWLRAAAIGLGVLFLFHLGLALFSPYMTGLPQAQLGQLWMRRINRMIDVVYAFYGLVGYAALPFLLWWVLTRHNGASAWSPPEPRTG